MMSTQVTKDQFEISQEGITHKPTGASFEPKRETRTPETGTTVASGMSFRMARAIGRPK